MRVEVKKWEDNKESSPRVFLGGEKGKKRTRAESSKIDFGGA